MVGRDPVFAGARLRQGAVLAHGDCRREPRREARSRKRGARQRRAVVGLARVPRLEHHFRGDAGHFQSTVAVIDVIVRGFCTAPVDGDGIVTFANIGLAAVHGHGDRFSIFQRDGKHVAFSNLYACIGGFFGIGRVKLPARKLRAVIRLVLRACINIQIPFKNHQVYTFLFNYDDIVVRIADGEFSFDRQRMAADVYSAARNLHIQLVAPRPGDDPVSPALISRSKAFNIGFHMQIIPVEAAVVFVRVPVIAARLEPHYQGIYIDGSAADRDVVIIRARPADAGRGRKGFVARSVYAFGFHAKRSAVGQGEIVSVLVLIINALQERLRAVHGAAGVYDFGFDGIAFKVISAFVFAFFLLHR